MTKKKAPKKVGDAPHKLVADLEEPIVSIRYLATALKLIAQAPAGNDHWIVDSLYGIARSIDLHVDTAEEKLNEALNALSKGGAAP